MEFTQAKTRFVRISPRKARLAAGLIRGLAVEDALWQLTNSRLKGGRLLKKTLKSAISNAENRLDARKKDLKVHEVRVDVGPTMKRSKSRNKGGMTPVMKRTSHFTIVLSNEANEAGKE